MPSPQATSSPPLLGAVDNGTALVLSAIEALHERVSATEALLRDVRSPTATMQALYALEAETINRMRGMSEVMNMVLGTVYKRLQEAAGGEGEGMTPQDIMSMMGAMAAAPPRPPAKSKKPTKKTRGT